MNWESKYDQGEERKNEMAPRRLKGFQRKNDSNGPVDQSLGEKKW